MPDSDDKDGVSADPQRPDTTDDDQRGLGPSIDQGVGRWLSRLHPVGRWAAGVAAAVVATATTAWLLAWGLLPDDRQQARPTQVSPSPAREDGDPTPHGDSPGDLPFTVAIKQLSDPNFGWITTLEPATAPPRPNHGFDGTWEDWAERAEAVPFDHDTIEFTVQGISDAQVTLTDLQVRVVERRPAIRGTRYGTAGGGPGVLRAATAYLDAEPPTMSNFYDGSFAWSLPRHEQRPIRFPYEVALSDAETFAILAWTDRCDCSFVIELDWASQGKTGTHVIDNDGEPFRVSGPGNTKRWCVAMPEGKIGGSEDCHPFTFNLEKYPFR